MRKPNSFQHRVPSGCMAVLLLVAGLFASCSTEEVMPADGTPLPAGEYPLMFTASVEGVQTRAGGKDTWADNDRIGVRIGESGAAGRYVLDENGIVKEDAENTIPVYWQSTAPATVTAWHPCEEKANIDISNQANGYAGFDYLTATATEQSYNRAVVLKFKHRMAKVKCTLVSGEGITADDLATAEVSFYGFTQASFKEGVLTGGTGATGWITPTNTDAGKEALLVPQEITTDRPFIKVAVTLGGKPREFFYTPVTAIQPEAGMVYTYEITVLRDKLNVVLTSTEAAWSEGSGITGGDATEVQYHTLTLNYNTDQITGTVTVANKDGEEISKQDVNTYQLPSTQTEFTITYTPTSWTKSFVPTTGLCRMNRSYGADEVIYKTELTGVISDLTLTLQEYAQVGDYYYSDGTWAPMDKAYAGGVGAATSIGVIFHNGAGPDDHIGNYDGLSEGTGILGYAVALNDLNDGNKTSWGGRIPSDGGWKLENFDVPELENNTCNKSGECDAVSYDGYTRTKIIRENYIPQSDTYSFPAFEACDDYQKTNPAPLEGKSSGWYIPSAAMMEDINTVKKKANIVIESRNADYLSSTETNAGGAIGYAFHSSVYTGRTKNDNNTYARAVLTIFKQKQ